MNLNYFMVVKYLCCTVILCMSNASLSEQAKSGSCTLPEYPQNGYWSVGGPGEQVGVNTLLKFTCDDGYTLTTKSISTVCTENGWNGATPECVRPCVTLFGTDNMKVECFSKGNNGVPCSTAIDGTQAVFQCASYHMLSDTNNKRLCSQGSWDYPPPRCNPVCGTKPITAVPLGIEDENGEINDEFPWVVALYKEEENKFVYIAVGTMLSPRIILTAAHAVSNEDGKANPPSKYKVGAGKRYVGFNDNRDIYAQYSNIEKIILHPSYKGIVLNYASDIAFLITKTKLVLSKWVQPACIIGLNSMLLSANTTGEVAGWGMANDKLSETVQKAHVQYKDKQICMRELPSDFANRYFVHDKFCAGSNLGGKIGCRGFSGSGFLVKQNQSYFVYGISSLAQHGSHIECYIEQNTLYTNVHAHYNWITEIISEYSDEYLGKL